MKKGILSLSGGTCPSCIMTIEKFGRKIRGIDDVHIDAGTREIRVDYEGDVTVLDEVREIVQKIGYDAEVLSVDATS